MLFLHRPTGAPCLDDFALVNIQHWSRGDVQVPSVTYIEARFHLLPNMGMYHTRCECVLIGAHTGHHFRNHGYPKFIRLICMEPQPPILSKRRPCRWMIFSFFSTVDISRWSKNRDAESVDALPLSPQSSHEYGRGFHNSLSHRVIYGSFPAWKAYNSHMYRIQEPR
jgi:hypothetical protein